MRAWDKFRAVAVPGTFARLSGDACQEGSPCCPEKRARNRQVAFQKAPPLLRLQQQSMQIIAYSVSDALPLP